MTTPGPADPKPTPPALPGAPAAPPAPANTGVNPPVPAPAKGTPSPPPPATALAVQSPRPATPAKPPKPAKSGSAAGAYLISVVALILAVAAGAGAAYAIKEAWAVRDAPNAAPTVVTTTITETVSPPPVVTTPAAPPPVTTPTITYVPDFVRVEVPVTGPEVGSFASVYVDVDGLAVGVQAGHEFYFATAGGPLRVFVDRTSGRALSPTPSPTPEACHERVAGTPTSVLEIPVQEGLTFCLLTNIADAVSQSLPQRLAIVEVTDVTAEGVLKLVVSTYRINNS